MGQLISAVFQIDSLHPDYGKLGGFCKIDLAWIQHLCSPLGLSIQSKPKNSL